MRVFIYLISAFFIACVASISPHYDRRNLDLATGAYEEVDDLVIGPVENHEEEASAGVPVIHHDTSTNEASANNRRDDSALSFKDSAMTLNFTSADSSPAIAGFPSEPKNLYAEVRIDPWEYYQHVGTLRKGRLENAIYQCLVSHCPLDRGLKRCTAEETPKCRIPHIVYDSSPNDPSLPKYAANAEMIITINYAYHNPAWKGIGEAAYRAIAALYRMATEHPGSCYEANFEGSRATTLCYVPESASVGFPVNEDHPTGDASEVQAMVAITVKVPVKNPHRGFNLHKPAGVFQQEVRRRFKNVDLPRIAAAVGRPTEDLNTRVVLKDPSHTPSCKEWWWYESSKCKKGEVGEAGFNGTVGELEPGQT